MSSLNAEDPSDLIVLSLATLAMVLVVVLAVRASFLIAEAARQHECPPGATVTDASALRATAVLVLASVYFEVPLMVPASPMPDVVSALRRLCGFERSVGSGATVPSIGHWPAPIVVRTLLCLAALDFRVCAGGLGAGVLADCAFERRLGDVSQTAEFPFARFRVPFARALVLPRVLRLIRKRPFLRNSSTRL